MRTRGPGGLPRVPGRPALPVRTLREPATAGAVRPRLGHLADRGAGRHPTWTSIAGKATRPISLATLTPQPIFMCATLVLRIQNDQLSAAFLTMQDNQTAVQNGGSARTVVSGAGYETSSPT